MKPIPSSITHKPSPAQQGANVGNATQGPIGPRGNIWSHVLVGHVEESFYSLCSTEKTSTNLMSLHVSSLISRQLSLRTVIFLSALSGWSKYLLHLVVLPNVLCQDTKHCGWSCSQSQRFLLMTSGAARPCFGRTRPCPRGEFPKSKREPGLVLKECSRHMTAGGKKRPGMLKQNGNERFYHNFFLSLLCARSPHHQLGEKWTPPALPSPSHPYCSR